MTTSTIYTELDFLPPAPEAVYPLDCRSRRAPDLTARMKLDFLISHLKTGTRAGFLQRQIEIVKAQRYRVAANREVVS